ncbi:sodium/potassium-transporting ATPase subunit beta-2-like [Daktulosphaira vitifoliae]|uniref:sodium/potassium-transporting ATPase subunit beta-2-like n=1 Tax=Daktulosphaira vitifoliae TaxID=58002 RepID=UPI0021AA681B|nr:sodium/potassium-transporting ATPase subunit beta-2-like [Daktulosphaira vitifoliae]
MVKHTTDTNGIGYEWEYAKVKDDRTIWQKIVMGIYNPNTHEVLGRSLRSWGGILLFYLVFYSSLAVLFGICLKLLLSTLDERTPHFTLSNSIIGTNPGLGFRPRSRNVEDGSLIYYEAKNSTNVDTWVNSLDDFLAVYKNKTLLPDGGSNQQQGCNHHFYPENGKVCDFRVDINMGNCTSEKKYGYPDGQPCVFIKLNKIFDWKPEFYNMSNLPDGMPKDLKNTISNKLFNDPNEVNTVWVSCEGETPSDRENIGPIDLHPEGFPGYYYPFTNKKDYLSPLIAVHFKKPKKHTLINVECRAWARNIVYRRSLQNREGSVHFELMID